MVYQIYIFAAMCTILCVLILLLFIQHCIKRRHLNKLTANIPCYPSLPFIGILNKIVNQNCEGIYKLFVSLLDANVDTLKTRPVKIWIGPKLCIVIAKPEYLQTIYTSSSTIEKAIYFYKNLSDILGETSYLYKPASLWKPHRKLYQTVFTSIKCSNKVNYMGTICTEYLKENESQISNKNLSFENVSDMLNVMVGKMVCFNVMDTKVIDSNRIFKYMKGAHISIGTSCQRMLKFWLHFDFIYKFSNQYKIQKYHQDQCNEFTTWYIENRREKRAMMKMNKEKYFDDENNETCLLDLLLDLEESGELTPQEVKHDCFLFFFAGAETTTFTTQVALLMIAMHSEVQEKLYEEIKHVLGDSEKPIDAENIKQMKYLEMVVKETMRLYTALPLLARNVTETMYLDDFIIPVGTTIVHSLYAVHHNSDIYPEPKMFNPERFKSENTLRPYSFIPFGGGSRNCIGKFGIIYIH